MADPKTEAAAPAAKPQQEGSLLDDILAETERRLDDDPVGVGDAQLADP